LGHDLPGVELDKHRAISFELFNRNAETEVVQDEELQLEVVKFDQRQASDLVTY
jgi:hypothetical protein